MRIFIFTVLLILTTPAISFCQDTTQALPVFPFVDEPPEFPGGENGLMKFLRINIRYPRKAADKEISGRIYLTFVIDTNGNVIKENVLRGVEGLNEEALRVVRSMPQWKPGRNEGKAVQVQYNLPIIFNLYKEKSTTPIKYYSLLNKGKKYKEEGNFEMAIIYFTKAIKEDNMGGDAHFNRACCFNELGFLNSACLDWRRAKDLDNSETNSKTVDSCFMVDLQNNFQTQFEFIDGGDAGLIKYLNDNLEYPELAKNNNIQGTVKVKMKVDSIGNLTDAKVYRGIGGGCDEEALRLIRSVKLWKPGYKAGEAVASEVHLPVRFRLKK